MDIKSKILLIVFLILLVLSVSYTFYKTVILQDFEVINTEELEEGEINEDEEIVKDQSLEDELTEEELEIVDEEVTE